MILEFNDIDVYAPVDGPTGYDTISRKMMETFYKKGYSVSLRKFPNWSPVKLELKPEMQAFLDKCVNTPVRSLVHLNICLPEQTSLSEFQYNLLYTMFEVDRIPTYWRDACNSSDLVFVPSTFCAQSFAQSGVDPNKLRIVGLGIDINEYHPDIEPLPLTDNQGVLLSKRFKYRFLNVQELVDRKNVLGLFESWIRATNEKDDACLILKLASYSEWRLDYFNLKLNNIREKLGKKGAPVFIFTRMLSEDDMKKFFAVGTHYFSMSFGEGWDLCAMQMGAMKKVVIAPYSSAYTMYLHNKNSYLVDIKEKVEATQGGVTARLYQGAKWSVPSIESATNIVRKVIDGDNSIDPNVLYDEIHKFWTWDKVVDGIIDHTTNLFFKRTVTYDLAPRIGNPGIMMICKTAGEECGIGDYSNNLYNSTVRNTKNPMMFLRGPDSSYLSWIDGNDLGIIHIQYEYQFHSLVRLSWLFHEIKIRQIKILLTQHTVTRQAIEHNDLLIKMCDKILVHCNKARNEYLSLYRGCEDKIAIVPMGCKPTLTFDKNDATNVIFGKKPGEVVIAFFGFVYFHKGIDVLMKMCGELSQKINGLQLHIFAKKPKQDNKSNYFEYCTDMMKHYKYPIKWYTEFLNEDILIKNLSYADVIALPYKEHGGWGTSAAIRTCLRAKVPIVCTNVSFFEDVPENVVRRVDMNSFTQALYEVVKNPELRGKYSDEIEKYVNETSWENVGKIHASIYNEMLNAK